MRVVYASTSPWSGQHLRWAIAMNRYSNNEARVLTQHDSLERRNELLEWADVIHCAYTCSAQTLGRPDLLGKKLWLWHLALKWRDKFWQYFPGDQRHDVRFLLACEGWERFGLPDDVEWTLVPQCFLIDDAPYRPLPVVARKRVVTASARDWYKRVERGKSNFRNWPAVRRALKGMPFKGIHKKPFGDCIRLKAASWLGIDDLHQPLAHLSGMEYLALGVPCLNRVDEVLRRSIGDCLGAPDVPFIDADIESVREIVRWYLKEPLEHQEARAVDCRRWMETYYHPKTVVQKYLEVYERG